MSNDVQIDERPPALPASPQWLQYLLDNRPPTQLERMLRGETDAEPDDRAVCWLCGDDLHGVDLTALICFKNSIHAHGNPADCARVFRAKIDALAAENADLRDRLATAVQYEIMTKIRSGEFEKVSHVLHTADGWDAYNAAEDKRYRGLTDEAAARRLAGMT